MSELREALEKLHDAAVAVPGMVGHDEACGPDDCYVVAALRGAIPEAGSRPMSSHGRVENCRDCDDAVGLEDEDPASHIGCRFNHAHRWPDCYDEAYEPDTLDRLMALWQQPWSEAAFGEAQMLVGRLRHKVRDAIPAEPPQGTRLVLVTEDADTLFFGRSDRGNRLSFVWGEPDEHGWYTPTITEHNDQPIPAEPLDVERLYEAMRGVFAFNGLRESTEKVADLYAAASPAAPKHPLAVPGGWGDLLPAAPETPRGVKHDPVACPDCHRIVYGAAPETREPTPNPYYDHADAPPWLREDAP